MRHFSPFPTSTSVHRFFIGSSRQAVGGTVPPVRCHSTTVAVEGAAIEGAPETCPVVSPSYILRCRRLFPSRLFLSSGRRRLSPNAVIYPLYLLPLLLFAVNLFGCGNYCCTTHLKFIVIATPTCVIYIYVLTQKNTAWRPAWTAVSYSLWTIHSTLCVRI